MPTDAPTLRTIAPRLHAAYVAERDARMRAISRCRHGGWHAYGAGPCFDTPEQAMSARDHDDLAMTAMCDRRAAQVAFYDRGADRWVTWAEHWDAAGWPDGRPSHAA